MGFLNNLYNATLEGQFGGNKEQLQADRRNRLAQARLQAEQAERGIRDLGGQESYDNLVRQRNTGAIKNDMALQDKTRDAAERTLDRDAKYAGEEDAKLERGYALDKQKSKISQLMNFKLSQTLQMSPEDLAIAGYSITMDKNGNPIISRNISKNIYSMDRTTGEVTKLGSIGEKDIIKDSGMTPNELENNARKEAGYNSTRKAKAEGFQGPWFPPTSQEIDDIRQKKISQYSLKDRALIQNSIDKKAQSLGVPIVTEYNTEDEVQYDIDNGTLNAGDVIMFDGEMITIGEL